jgi:predicted dehydrogenase
MRTLPLIASLLLAIAVAPALVVTLAAQSAPSGKRVGMIGLDTSHSTAFVNALNATDSSREFGGYRVVAAYPYGSRSIESSYSRIPRYTEEVKAAGVEIVASVGELLERLDVVLLETNDGRLHLEQALEVIRAGKPLFIDKPMAASLTDVIAIFEAATRQGVPVFSSSSLRYEPDVQAVRNGSIGRVLGADAYSPAHLEPTHPDLFWYGIHGVEILFSVMGTGCEAVTRVHTADTDLVTCRWADGRLGTFRGLRARQLGYGGTAFGTDGIAVLTRAGQYDALLRTVTDFFRTGVAPVPTEETIEIFAFMAAADESKSRDGASVSVPALIAVAREEAARRLAGH